METKHIIPAACEKKYIDGGITKPLRMWVMAVFDYAIRTILVVPSALYSQKQIVPPYR